MGKVLSVISRPIKNFNIESRAHKIISKDKPVQAPTFQANIREAERLLKENPDSLTNLLRKDSTLDTNLKDVFVKSYDPNTAITESKITDDESNRPLPVNRRMVKYSEFGFTEPNTIPPGRCTLRQVLKLLSDHQSNPKDWNSTKEALNYNLPEETIKNIVNYFRVYHVYIPDEGAKVVFGAPSLPKKDRLESGDKSNL